MILLETKQVSPGCVKITSDTGLAFFIRSAYLKTVSPEALVPGAVFSGDAEAELVDAGLAFSAESKAVEYLARAEQCRFKLTRKLLEKQFSRGHIDAALDYLEGVQYLSDGRYARAWLNARKISHAEGRIRLAAELAARGISRETARQALDEFFSENSEMELCRRAYQKLLRSKKAADREAAFRALVQRGFGGGMIRTVLEEAEAGRAGI
ncbi:MAG: recombination regulator RecX [Treponemataceae bacterium]|nr:recombination regulator RecX [Treponemataceae bacterium]